MPRHHLAAQARDAHLQALEVGQGVHRVAEPSAHLRAGVAGGEGDDAVVLEERIERVDAAGVIHPRVLLARGEPEWQRRAEAEGEVLADVVVGRRVAELDGALLNGIECLESRHDVAGREHADVEFAVGELVHALGEELAAAIDRFQALRKARGQAPADRGLRLRDGRSGKGGAGGEREPRGKDVSTLHDGFPLGPGELATSHKSLHVRLQCRRWPDGSKPHAIRGCTWG